LADTLAGARAVRDLPGLPVVLGIGALVVLTGAMFNVLAPLLATGPVHAGGSGYSVLMSLYGLGMVGGSWANARAGSDVDGLRRRWLFGIALSGVAMATAALVPNFGFALVAFTLIGVGESLLVGPEMRLVQELIAERLLGRVFGFKDAREHRVRERVRRGGRFARPRRGPRRVRRRGSADAYAGRRRRGGVSRSPRCAAGAGRRRLGAGKTAPAPPRDQASAPADAYSNSHDVRYPSRHRIGKNASSSSVSPGRRYRE
jgi:hypothetical protein